MPKQVYVYPKMERQLESLAQQAKPACISTARAKRIMDALARGEAPTSAGLLKRKTDKRLIIFHSLETSIVGVSLIDIVHSGKY